MRRNSSNRRSTTRSTTSVRAQAGKARGLLADVSRGDGIVAPRSARARQRGIVAPRSARARQRGFSLIEIILVVVLIGGIVAFAATRILGGGDRAKANLAKAQVQTLAEKVQQYEMDTGTLPDSLAALVSSDAPGWLGPYAKDAELNDPWNEPIRYTVPGEAGPFDLLSLGADRQPGGASVDADIAYE